jgi:hypothetical protein
MAAVWLPVPAGLRLLEPGRSMVGLFLPLLFDFVV